VSLWPNMSSYFWNGTPIVVTKYVTVIVKSSTPRHWLWKMSGEV